MDGDSVRPEVQQHVKDRYLPKIGTLNWDAWVAQLTDDEIERLNARRDS